MDRSDPDGHAVDTDAKSNKIIYLIWLLHENKTFAMLWNAGPAKTPKAALLLLAPVSSAVRLLVVSLDDRGGLFT